MTLRFAGVEVSEADGRPYFVFNIEATGAVEASGRVVVPAGAVPIGRGADNADVALGELVEAARAIATAALR